MARNIRQILSCSTPRKIAVLTIKIIDNAQNMCDVIFLTIKIIDNAWVASFSLRLKLLTTPKSRHASFSLRLKLLITPKSRRASITLRLKLLTTPKSRCAYGVPVIAGLLLRWPFLFIQISSGQKEGTCERVWPHQ